MRHIALMETPTVIQKTICHGEMLQGADYIDYLYNGLLSRITKVNIFKLEAMYDKRLSSFNVLRKNNLKHELYLILKAIKKIQQKHLTNNDVWGYHDFKEKSNIMLDIWRQINNPKIHENYIKKYIDTLILLIEDIWKTYEGFSIPRDASGALLDVNYNAIKLLNQHHEMLEHDYSNKSIWSNIIEQRQTNKTIIDVSLKNNSVALEETTDDNHVHLFFEIKAMLFKVENEVNLRFLIYDKNNDQFLTDSYEINQSGNKNFGFLDNESVFKAVFKDLDELKPSMYLVCKLFKIEESGFMFPFATYCVSLKELAEMRSGRIFTPEPKNSNIYAYDKNSDFIHMHKLIIKEDKTIQLVKNSRGILVSMVCHKGDFSEIIASKKEEGLDEYVVVSTVVNDENINSLEDRIDMQITLLKGRFTQDAIKYYAKDKLKSVTKSKSKNVMVEASLFNESGEAIKNCFRRSSNRSEKESDIFRSFIFRNENNPVYNEIFYIAIPEKELLNAVLFLKYIHCSAKDNSECAFGFSFIPLKSPNSNKKLIMSNGSKDLSVYCGSALDGRKMSFTNMSGFTARKDSFYVSTLYNSSQYSHNEYLNSILHWESSILEIDEALEKFQLIPNSALLKCAKKTFDSLFEMISSVKIQKNLKEKILASIIHLIHEIVFNGKASKVYKNATFIEKYIDSSFDQKNLNYNLIEYFESFLKSQKRNNLDKTLSTVEFIFHFIFASEKQRAEGDFKCSEKMVSIMTIFIATTSDIQQKISATKSIQNMLKLLEEDIPKDAVAKKYFAVLEMLEKDEANPEIKVAVLNLLYNLVSVKTGADISLQKQIFSKAVQKIKERDYRSVSLVEDQPWVNVLKKVIISLGASIMGKEKEDRIELILEVVKIIPNLIELIQQLMKKAGEEKENYSENNKYQAVSKLYQESMVCMWQILLFCVSKDSTVIWNTLEKAAVDKIKVTEDLLAIFIQNYRGSMLNESWVAIKVVRAISLSNWLNELIQIGEELVEPEYKKHIFENIFKLYMLLINDSIFETGASKTKDEYVKRNLKIDWQKFFQVPHSLITILGARALDFKDIIITKAFRIKQKNKYVEKSFSIAICKIMKLEYNTTKKLVATESELINNLYEHISTNKAKSPTTIIQMLMEPVNEDPDKDFKAEALKLLQSLEKIKECAERIVLVSNELEYTQLDIFIELFKILENKKEIDKKVYINYFRDFVEMHCTFKNWIEAGMAQMKYIEMTGHAARNEGDLLEAYKTCLKHYEQGKDLERCIDVCTLIEKQYLEMFDYEAMDEILKQKAAFFEKIAKEKKRFFPNYYRVCFQGDYDPELTAGEWVFCSKILEPLNQFSSRILENYKNSVIGSAKDKTIKSAKVIYLTSLTVPTKPSTEPATQKCNKANSEKRKLYNENNYLNEFYYTVPVQKGEKTSFKTMWTKKINVRTEDHFPTLYRKSKVTATWEEMITPIDSAIDAIELKNKSLRGEIENVGASGEASAEAMKVLSVALNGIIDAAVSGGTKLYIEAFFVSKPLYTELYPEEKGKIGTFVQAIEEQQRLLDQGLDVLKHNIGGFEALYSHLLKMHQSTVKTNHELLNKK